MRVLARTHGIVLPVSYFERDGERYYNSLALFDADGREVGHYRKSHIPDGPGYEEKFFFAPGDTGFSAFDTRFGRIGVGICWDQWFPECARAMTLLGADLLAVSERDRQRAHAQRARHQQAVAARDARPRRREHDPARREQPRRRRGRPALLRHELHRRRPRRASWPSSAATKKAWRSPSSTCAAWRKERDWFGLLRDRRPELYGKLVEKQKKS